MATRRVRTLADVPVSNETQAVIDAIRKRHGDRSVVVGSSIRQPYRIPTGIFTFDLATCGGIPHNRVTMFHGPKHSGKTTASLRCIAGAQVSMPNQQPVLVDVEGTYDSTWAGKVGVDNERLHLVQPDNGESAVDMTVGLMQAREVSLVVVDSLAALLPQKEEEASAEDSLVGQQSRLITSMLRKMNGALIKERKRGHYVSVLLINQQRSKIGGWAPAGIEPISNPGGKAVGFFTSLEVRWKNKEVLKATNGSDVLAHNDHAFTIEKNKMHAGIRTGEFRMLRRDDDELGLSEGAIDDAETMLAFAKRNGWLTGGGRGGITLEFANVKEHFAKVDDAVIFLYQNPDIHAVLRASLIATHAQSMNLPESFVNYLLGQPEEEEEVA